MITVEQKKLSVFAFWAVRVGRYASVGDVIVVSVKSVIPSSDIKKGAVSKA